MRSIHRFLKEYPRQYKASQMFIRWILLFSVCIAADLAVIFGAVGFAEHMPSLTEETFLILLISAFVLTQILLTLLCAAVIRSWWTILVAPVCVYLAIFASVFIGMGIGFAMDGKFTADPPGWRDPSLQSKR